MGIYTNVHAPHVAGYQQPVMQGGPIVYKRKYTLWVLVVLILFCWPAAIIYYFTRDKVPVQEMQTYAVPAQAPQPMASPAYGAASPPSAGVGAAAPACKNCGKPTTFMPQYNRYYCYSCAQYA